MLGFAECGTRGAMLTGKQAGQGGRPRPHPAHQAAPRAAVLQAAALAAAVAAVLLQDPVEATPVHHPVAVVEASHNRQPVSKQMLGVAAAAMACTAGLAAVSVTRA